ncbi:MAG: ATP-binding cassette domain-containing protein [Azovibrio sp.]|nr:ATP-binding cassette domain-containing protein [Azovibrio sp.]
MILLEAHELVAGWQQPLTAPCSFSLKAGEILGLTGPNGAGKSTLLAALAGVGRIFAGMLRRPAGLRLGFQPQAQPPLAGLPLSGSELLDLTGAPAEGLPPWLADCLSRRLDRLSGGQRQYLALWAVLQSPAQVLLLDEPGNHLDQPGIQHLCTALRQRAAAGAGILLVSHDETLLACCDRRLQLEPGDA